MHPKTQEEILSALWIIAALLAFQCGYMVAGWTFLALSAFHCAAMLYFNVWKRGNHKGENISPMFPEHEGETTIEAIESAIKEDEKTN